MAATRKIRNLNDLAERFGCTATTVSMALRDSPQLSSELKQKIQAAALENDFVPRSYTRRKVGGGYRRDVRPGPVLILHNDFYREQNPARDFTMPHVFRLLGHYGIEYAYLDVAELQQQSALMQRFAGVLYYNDQEITIPAGMPTVQIFGWKPLQPGQDRITVDDVAVARMAMEFYLRSRVKRVVMVWREDMIGDFYEHPRIGVLEKGLRAAGVPVSSLLFSRQDTDFLDRLREYIHAGEPEIGFWAFNAVSGLKLCCALDSLQLMPVYAPSRVLVCDNDAILHNFWPRPQVIDLDFPMLACRAVNLLLWRMENPDSPETITYQAPRMVRASVPSDVDK